MNWGKRILFIYLAFVAGIVLLVVKSHGKEVSLVRKDYYDQELKYSDRMRALQNYHALPEGIEVVQKPTKIRVALPVGHWQVDSRTVFMYKPDNPRADKVFQIEPDEKGILDIDKTVLEQGKYLLKIDWVQDQIPYAFEQSVIVH
jgi:hypothetical protein